jgi:hypothetical protein
MLKNYSQPTREPKNELRKHEAWQLLTYMAMPHPQEQITLRNGSDREFELSSRFTFDPAEQYLESRLASQPPDETS